MGGEYWRLRESHLEGPFFRSKGQYTHAIQLSIFSTFNRFSLADFLGGKGIVPFDLYTLSVSGRMSTDCFRAINLSFPFDLYTLSVSGRMSTNCFEQLINVFLSPDR